MNPPSTLNPQLSTIFGSRLVTLCDGRFGLRGGLRVDIREPERYDAFPSPGGEGRGEGGSSLPPITRDPSPVLDFISSDETLDRYDEILVASGWRLENYRRNPVFQNAHQYGDIIFTLGRALLTEVRDGRLYQRIEFATDVNPMARIAYGLYKGKFLNAVSVGFIPIRWENGAADAGYRRRYLEQELLEVSAVGIPANPNALALGLKAGAIEKTDLHDLLELLRASCESPARRTGFQPVSIEDVGPTGILPNSIWTSAESRTGFQPVSNLTPDQRQAGSLSYEEHFRSPPAAPNTPACASGVRRDEAQWLQLARELRKVIGNR